MTRETKLEFDQVKQEDIDTLVLNVLDDIWDTVNIPEDKIAQYENDLCMELDEVLSNFFNNPDYRNHN